VLVLVAAGQAAMGRFKMQNQKKETWRRVGYGLSYKDQQRK